MLLGKSSVFLALMGIVLYQLYQKTTEPLQISIGKTREEKDKDSFLNQLEQDAKNEKEKSVSFKACLKTPREKKSNLK